MLRTKTVFILGAGASVDYGMPLGSTLLRDVALKLKDLDSGNSEVGYYLRDYFRPTRDVINRCKTFAVGMPSKFDSIDTALDFYDDEELTKISKFTIAHTILHHESTCSLKNNQITKRSWVDELCRIILGTGSKHRDLDGIFENVHFINFNYDRCLEVDLIRCLRELGFTEEDAKRATFKIDIIRPYGSVGLLSQMSFGNTNYEGLKSASTNIRTLVESCEAEMADQIKKLVKSCQRAVFLGFGFHRQNINLLIPPQSNHISGMNVLATTHKMSESDTDMVRHQLRAELSIFSEPILDKIDCQRFLAERTLYLQN